VRLIISYECAAFNSLPATKESIQSSLGNKDIIRYATSKIRIIKGLVNNPLRAVHDVLFISLSSSPSPSLFLWQFVHYIIRLGNTRGNIEGVMISTRLSRKGYNRSSRQEIRRERSTMLIFDRTSPASDPQG